MVTKKKPTKKSAAKPKTKIVYRTKYVKEKKRESPMGETGEIIRDGMGLMMGVTLINAAGHMLSK